MADYIDSLLGAFSFDPPRIWAGGPTSGRFGGRPDSPPSPLTPLDELAWRMRIEGSLGLPEREFNGPVVGLQQRYRQGLAGLGDDFCDVERRRAAQPPARRRRVPDLLYQHAARGCTALPSTGATGTASAWRAIDFEGDVQPRGYTDAEVSGRDRRRHHHRLGPRGVHRRRRADPGRLDRRHHGEGSQPPARPRRPDPAGPDYSNDEIKFLTGTSSDPTPSSSRGPSAARPRGDRTLRGGGQLHPVHGGRRRHPRRRQGAPVSAGGLPVLAPTGPGGCRRGRLAR